MALQETARAAPAIAGSDPHNSSCLAADGSENASKADVFQAKIDLLVDDVVDTAKFMVDQLYVLPAQRVAADYSGMLYTLRRSRCYWRHISAVARELAEINNDRLSALRQAEGGYE